MADGKVVLLAYWGLHTRHDDIAFGPGSPDNERALGIDDYLGTLQLRWHRGGKDFVFALLVYLPYPD